MIPPSFAVILLMVTPINYIRFEVPPLMIPPLSEAEMFQI